MTLCDGRVVYLLDSELSLLLFGSYTIDQEIPVTGWDQTFQVGAGGVDAQDLFALRLYYGETTPDDPISGGQSNISLQGTPQLNGNIANMIWQTKGREQQYYAFSYDELDRLTGAQHYQITPARFSQNGQATLNPVNRYSVSNLTYDLRGNILSLDRQGELSSCTAPQGQTFGTIDQLTYSYNTQNQLIKLVDATNVTLGFKDETVATDYEYDANGNMTVDRNKGITIDYNFLNLPEKIIFTSTGAELELIYDATGTKLKKISRDASGNETIKDYLAGMEYTTKAGVTELEAIYHEEGRVTKKERFAGDYQLCLRIHPPRSSGQ